MIRQAVMQALFVVMLPVTALAQSQEDVARRADPAVGRVVVYSAQTGSINVGSGFVLATVNDGASLLFLTNAHVIDGADELKVGFLQDGEVYVYEAFVVRVDGKAVVDKEHDLAVLIFDAPQSNSENFLHEPVELPIRDLTARRGEPVAALGFPYASDAALGTQMNDPDFFNSTITFGNASKILHQTWGKGGSPFEIVQHTASVNPGNSGGPLLDLCAQVVGLNTSVALDERTGGNANETYFASGSTTLIDFLYSNGIPHHTGGDECGTAQGPAGPPITSEPSAGPSAKPASENVSARPIWLIALVSFGLAVGLIGAVIAFVGRGRAGTTGPRSPNAASAPVGPVMLLRLGDGPQRAVTSADLARGLRIGRGAEAEFQIEAQGISRLHAMLRLVGQQLMLSDLGSTNGTWVDEVAIAPNKPVPITSRSKIRLGSQRLKIARKRGAV